MRVIDRLLFIAPAAALALALAPAREALACGGGFFVPAENVEVASHRMILSVSQAQSTLYDQIRYGGSPSSFAWVLPIKGTVTVGLSSDALFEQIDQLTAVTVSPPFQPPNCFCGGCTDTSASETGTGGGPPPDGGVTIISQMVVGPYETTQLSSSDPTALDTWLTTHGYAIPSNITPVISAYISGGFDFLAVKLVPGMSVSAMKPISVTTPGASPVLPLRMVAAGVGATVPITLFVLGEGRYEPTNFTSFTIDTSQLVWDFNSESSNYATLRSQAFTANPSGWLVESAQPMSEQSISAPLDQLVQVDPIDSGYADSMGNGAPAAEMADLTTLFSGISASSFYVTRLLAEMPASALSTDLTLGAAASQASVPNQLTAPMVINYPTCPPCGGCTGGSGVGASGVGASGVGGAGSTGHGGASTGSSGQGGAGTGGGSAHSGSSCAVGPSEDAPLAFGVVAVALAAVASRRRRAIRRA